MADAIGLRNGRIIVRIYSLLYAAVVGHVDVVVYLAYTFVRLIFIVLLVDVADGPQDEISHGHGVVEGELVALCVSEFSAHV